MNWILWQRLEGEYLGHESPTSRGSPGGSAVKNLPANAGDTGLILGSESSPEEEMKTYSSILAWEIAWTEERSGLQSTGSQRIGHNLATKTTAIPTSTSCHYVRNEVHNKCNVLESF